MYIEVRLFCARAHLEVKDPEGSFYCVLPFASAPWKEINIFPFITNKGGSKNVRFSQWKSCGHRIHRSCLFRTSLSGLLVFEARNLDGGNPSPARKDTVVGTIHFGWVFPSGIETEIPGCMIWCEAKPEFEIQRYAPKHPPTH